MADVMHPVLLSAVSPSSLRDAEQDSGLTFQRSSAANNAKEGRIAADMAELGMLRESDNK